jgi:hypothetical protein
MAFRLDEALLVLERTPALLAAWLGGLPEAWLAADEGPGTFSARDVLAHLVSGEEDDWMPRVRVVLAHGEGKAFTPFDRFAFRERFAGLSTAALLERFARLRAEGLAALRALELGPRELERRGRHPELGAVTLEQLLATWVVHDLGHLAQIARVQAKRYRAEVGPWRAYLPVLER